ncbi:hypothetical protein F4824DRAFT_472609 [Ustulina deusta]|nr:hypothetical protein F4824DRAFT_472609 [Ustulina deusta]
METSLSFLQIQARGCEAFLVARNHEFNSIDCEVGAMRAPALEAEPQSELQLSSTGIVGPVLARVSSRVPRQHVALPRHTLTAVIRLSGAQLGEKHTYLHADGVAWLRGQLQGISSSKRRVLVAPH